MHVIVTAGHVDHGKTALVDALTGMSSDRLTEERRRGLSIELGYVWTELPGAGQIAFVDVPGHERFISTALSGMGPVPMALLVVAADDPWMPQAAEHLAALHALGVSHAVVAISRVDLADPGPINSRIKRELVSTSLRDAEVVPVSARSGEGLSALRVALATMVSQAPTPDSKAGVRLWIDRHFTVRGTGTVITGTLSAGTISAGQRLEVPLNSSVRVRGIQLLGSPVPRVSEAARVALNLTGDSAKDLSRGDWVVSSGSWHISTEFDVRVLDETVRLPALPQLHLGSSSQSVRSRRLGDGIYRLVLRRPLPVHIGDRAILRDPGSRHIWAIYVLDPTPSPFRRRGAAKLLAAKLSQAPAIPDLSWEVRRHGIVNVEDLRLSGIDTNGSAATGTRRYGEWLMSERWAQAKARAATVSIAQHQAANPLAPGMPVHVLAKAISLPSADLVAPLVGQLHEIHQGLVRGDARSLPGALEAALERLTALLEVNPFAAPTTTQLKEYGFGPRELAAAARARRVLLLPGNVTLLPDAGRRAAEMLRVIPQPFSASDARQRLSTTRRVVLPLLEHLDRLGVTLRDPDDRRSFDSSPTPGG